MHTRKLDSRLFVHLFFILFSLLFVLPFLLVIAISLSREADVVEHGYKLIPREIDFTAYRIVFRNTSEMTRAYGVTAFQSVVTMALSLTIMSMCAYSLARRSFALRKPITFFIFFTMLFGGGLIPSYILNTQYLHIGNTIWIYILPSLANAFYIIIFRTFFQGLPDGLIESAKIDGAGELRVYWQIVVPLSKPVFATFALFVLLERWNDWFQSLIYVRDAKLYT
ncbi:MAG: carbohydrate ABC transporter permease, partial [Paenibacillaceae bacterium]|nr:carbohydrate ABC transporter permease [Paenibacillaceae bacterium]